MNHNLSYFFNCRDRLTDEYKISYAIVNCPSDVLPIEYLSQSIKDYSSGMKLKNINAISNAKKALDCQIRFIFEIYGLKQMIDSEFAQRIQILGYIGILAPNILIKFKDFYNLMENEFIIPSDDQTENFIDIVSMFLENSNLYISQLPKQMDVIEINNPNNRLVAAYHLSKYYFEIEDIWIDGERVCEEDIIIDNSGEKIDFEYIEMMKIWIQLSVGFSIPPFHRNNLGIISIDALLPDEQFVRDLPLKQKQQSDQVIIHNYYIAHNKGQINVQSGSGKIEAAQLEEDHER